MGKVKGAFLLISALVLVLGLIFGSYLLTIGEWLAVCVLLILGIGETM
jgi:hypothetical protein